MVGQLHQIHNRWNAESRERVNCPRSVWSDLVRVCSWHVVRRQLLYDPKSRILFSGDLGANLCPPDVIDKPAKYLDEVLPYMEGFHKRYMNSNQVCRYWANMVAKVPIDMIVPQHGRAFIGKAVPQLIRWISELQCGIDLMTEANYRVP